MLRRLAPLFVVPPSGGEDRRKPVLRSWCGSTLGLAAVAAALWWAALPPLDWWPLAWIAPIAWVVLIRFEKLPGSRPYAALWLAGFGFWLAALHWLRLPHPATAVGWVALAFYLGFYLPVFVGLSRVAVHRLRVPVVFAAPVVWTGLELARAHLLTGITMGALAHTQYRWLPLIQVSDLAGAYAVDFVIVLVAASLGGMIPGPVPVLSRGTAPVFSQRNRDCPLSGRAYWPLVPAALVLGAALLYGRARISQAEPAPTTRVALIQGSVDIELKHDPQRRHLIDRHYRELTDQAVEQFDDLDAIIWPETMFRQTLVTFSESAMPPGDWKYTDEQFRQALEEAARQGRSRMAEIAVRAGVPLVLGADRQHYGARAVKRFNSAVLVEADGRVAGYYDKMHRVVFGEYVPLADKLPWLQRMTPLPFSLNAGVGPVAFEVGSLRIAPNICYESVLSHVIRRQVNRLARAGREPDALVNLTNDGWFWGSSELDMHLACGVFRAVECRKPFLAAANTGISAWVDGNGKIRLRGPRREPDVLLAEVEPDARGSWYLEHGDAPAGSCLAACLMLAAVALWGRRRPRPEGPSTATVL